ncbi:hypothetical protein CEUSTIGMA_g10944.t1 [Chlamydomonas eustigma]|uniref:Nucleotide exchange factor Fes1 domain-containing protein n=1 Tax=Chlamydomonas eustigma TaxID=1157962 RepID=A0A250XKS4_9CHLO|nr:hypothetical protein CEUSTIGMA_g10944.t1 [Chlamydomonas eustigma]|eukprot:GAX83519.1 hypothetical protein CEUSTIGMA_g10944.t1 [Chlamydomonas eustigma]
MSLLLLTSSVRPGVRADFGEAIMFEAADLSEAHSPDQEEEARNMESLLHWAIEHSDPEELAKHADKVRTTSMIHDLTEQLEQRRARVQELRQYLDSQVTETQLMKESIALLSASNTTLPVRLAALQELQVLVEPIDNANDLKVLGGLEITLEHFLYGSVPKDHLWNTSDPTEAGWMEADLNIRAAAAHVLGTAAANNVKFQEQLMEVQPDIFSKLIEASLSPYGELAVKAVYALGAMVRNLDFMHQAFESAGGYAALQTIFSSEQSDAMLRVQRKALALYVDLLTNFQTVGSQLDLLNYAVSLVEIEDLDLTEKVLSAVKAALEGPQPSAAALLLERMHAGDMFGMRLHKLEDEGTEDEYSEYLSKLCRQVLDMMKMVHSSTSRDSRVTSDEQRQEGGRRNIQHHSNGGGTEQVDQNNASSEPMLQLGHSEL